MIADDRRPYCDLRSAICDPRAYGNQPLMQSPARSFKKDKNCKAVYLTKSLGPFAFPLHCLQVWRKKGLRWLELRRRREETDDNVKRAETVKQSF